MFPVNFIWIGASDYCIAPLILCLKVRFRIAAIVN